jgi:hypothetical protein
LALLADGHHLCPQLLQQIEQRLLLIRIERMKTLVNRF